MNYSPPRGDKTRPREEAQPCKQVPGAEICLLMTSLGWGWACRAAFRGASVLGAREKLGLIRGRSRRPSRAICQTAGLGAITGGPAGLAARAFEGWPVCVRACLCVCVHSCACLSARMLRVLGRAGMHQRKYTRHCVWGYACAGCVWLSLHVCSICALCIGAVIYVQVCTYVNIRLCVSAMYEYADMCAHVCKCGAFVRADLVGVGMCEGVHSCGCADTVHVCFTCSMCVQKHSIPTYMQGYCICSMHMQTRI